MKTCEVTGIVSASVTAYNEVPTLLKSLEKTLSAAARQLVEATMPRGELLSFGSLSPVPRGLAPRARPTPRPFTSPAGREEWTRSLSCLLQRSG